MHFINYFKMYKVSPHNDAEEEGCCAKLLELYNTGPWKEHLSNAGEMKGNSQMVGRYVFIERRTDFKSYKHFIREGMWCLGG